MQFIIAGFIFGLLIPYMARRFSKVAWATPAVILWQMCKIHKSKPQYKEDLIHRRLSKKYMWRCLMYGLISASLSALVWLMFAEVNTWWFLVFVWALLLAAEIDIRMLILPDFLTIPLIVSGFVFATYTSGFVTASESAAGAAVGYLLPLLATLLMLWYNSEAFGNGDIKMLIAIGAWMGPERLVWTILLSCIIFGICSVARRQRAGAYGPALSAAAIIILLFLA